MSTPLRAQAPQGVVHNALFSDIPSYLWLPLSLQFLLVRQQQTQNAFQFHSQHIGIEKSFHVEIPICDLCADAFHLKWRCKEFRVHQWSNLRKETKWVKGRSNYTICELAHKLPHEEFIEYLKDNGIYIVNESGVELGW